MPSSFSKTWVNKMSALPLGQWRRVQRIVRDELRHGDVPMERLHYLFEPCSVKVITAEVWRVAEIQVRVRRKTRVVRLKAELKDFDNMRRTIYMRRHRAKKKAEAASEHATNT